MAESDNSTRVAAFVAYKITCTATAKSYIGITARTIRARWLAHSAVARSGKSSKSSLHEEITILGEASFLIEHLASAASYAELRELEKLLILQERTLHPSGYNLNCGGQGSESISELTRQRRSAVLRGRTRSAEHRAKLSAAKLGIKQSPEHIESRISQLRGRKQDPDFVAKRTEKLKGRKLSTETVEKMRSALTGKTHSAETKAQMSVSRTGRPFSEQARSSFREAQNRPEAIAARRLRMVGTKHSESTRAKISAANSGKIVSGATRAKLSAAAIRRYALAKGAQSAPSAAAPEPLLG